MFTRQIRSIILALLVMAGLIALTSILTYLLPQFLSRPLNDYDTYVGWGRDAENGTLSYMHPLPALLWIFIPLSHLPREFVLIWIAIPFAYSLYAFGINGGILWLFYPTLVQVTLGELDGPLLFPLYWLLVDHPLLAAPSAAVMTLKPQVAVFLIPVMILRWVRGRRWKKLLTFTGVLAILYAPAFYVDPAWPVKMIAPVQARAIEPLLLNRGASIWAWLWHGSWTAWTLPGLILIILFLSIKSYRIESNRPRTAQLIALLVIPIYYPVSMLNVIPTLQNSRPHLITITVVSWLGVAVDIWMGGWGGGYVMIPLTALGLLAYETLPLTPPNPTKRIEPKDITREGRKDIL